LSEETWIVLAVFVVLPIVWGVIRNSWVRRVGGEKNMPRPLRYHKDYWGVSNMQATGKYDPQRDPDD
jgi:hypothetical protein